MPKQVYFRGKLCWKIRLKRAVKPLLHYQNWRNIYRSYTGKTYYPGLPNEALGNGYAEYQGMDRRAKCWNYRIYTCRRCCCCDQIILMICSGVYPFLAISTLFYEIITGIVSGGLVNITWTFKFINYILTIFMLFWVYRSV